MKRVLRFGLLLWGAIFAQSMNAQPKTTHATPGSQRVVVASKPFGESYLLCEMFA